MRHLSRAERGKATLEPRGCAGKLTLGFGAPRADIDG
jgi:hypothetical protein